MQKILLKSPSGAQSGILFFSENPFFLLDPLSFFSITMTKMVTRSSPNKGRESDSPPKSQNLLKTPSLELCRFTDPKVDQFFTHFPPNTVLCPFDSPVKSDSVSSTWHFFTLTGLSYNQTMPMLWRVLYTLEQIIKDEGLDFNLSELAYLYNLVSHDSHRFVFKAKPQQPLPLLKTTKNDTN
ncbi:hypothetical protein Hanom_Chr02g00152261 [Helianthus anomalus]